MTGEALIEKIDLLGASFEQILYGDNDIFLEHVRKNNRSGDDPSKYLYWGWFQGVGLFGFWKIFEETGNDKYLDILKGYYKKTLAIGLPSKNINTVTPMLTLAYLYEHTQEDVYLALIEEWADWIYNEMPRTSEGAYQHTVSASLNEGELWDDTLFMTVLFLAKAGLVLNRPEYIEEVKYQFMVHIKYLADRKTGMWFHGWTFKGNHNFVEALWGRGNCWVTVAIPEFIDMIGLSEEDAVHRFLSEALSRQAEALKVYQNEGGMWHTLVDDKTSYLEISGTAGFGAGLAKAIRMKLIPESYMEIVNNALGAVMGHINKDGVVTQVSDGTPMGRTSKDLYKEIPLNPRPYGQALVMLFLYEVIRLNDQMGDKY